MSNGSKYRADGSPLGDTGGKWNRPSDIEAVTPEIRAAIRKSELVGAISSLTINDWKTLDVIALEAVFAQIALSKKG